MFLFLVHLQGFDSRANYALGLPRLWQPFRLSFTTASPSSPLRRTKQKRHRLSDAFFRLVHLQGLEPWTHWLRVSCSTNWARGAYKYPLKTELEVKRKAHALLAELQKAVGASRSISIGQPSTLLHLHLRPINLVVYERQYGYVLVDL